MIGDENYVGPTEFFQGAMTVVVTKNVKVIKFLAASTFAAGGLTMMYPAVPAATDALAQPSSITAYPAFAELRYVKAFKLLTGSIQVIYFAQ